MSLTAPIVSLQIQLAKGTPVNAPQRILIVGQKTAGTALADVLVENIPNTRDEDVLFGADSMVAAQVRAFKAINQVSQVDVIPLSDDGAGVAAESDLVFGGVATAPGVFTITIGSRGAHTVDIAVAVGDTNSDVSSAVAAAFALDVTLPVVITPNSPSGGQTLLVAVNAGTEGNNITLVLTGTVPGITALLNPMGGGATDPDTSATFTGGIPADVRYQQILVPDYALFDATTYLNTVFNVSNNILDGVAVAVNTDTLSNLKAENVLLGALHDSVLFGNKPVVLAGHTGGAIVELNTVLTSIFGAIKALRLTKGAPISQFVQTTDASLDAFGGPHLASMPYHNTIMRGMPIIGTGLNWTPVEIDDLSTDGVSVFVNNDQKTAVVPRTVFVGFKNVAGVNGFLNITDTASQTREFFFNEYKERFKNTRLTSGDDFTPGHEIVNKAIIEAFTDGRYSLLAGPRFVLMRGDPDTLALFKRNRVVTLDLEQGKVTINMLIFPQSQLREIQGVLEVSFLTAGSV